MLKLNDKINDLFSRDDDDKTGALLDEYSDMIDQNTSKFRDKGTSLDDVIKYVVNHYPFGWTKSKYAVIKYTDYNHNILFMSGNCESDLKQKGHYFIILG